MLPSFVDGFAVFPNDILSSDSHTLGIPDDAFHNKTTAPPILLVPGYSTSALLIPTAFPGFPFALIHRADNPDRRPCAARKSAPVPPVPG